MLQPLGERRERVARKSLSWKILLFRIRFIYSKNCLFWKVLCYEKFNL